MERIQYQRLLDSNLDISRNVKFFRRPLPLLGLLLLAMTILFIIYRLINSFSISTESYIARTGEYRETVLSSSSFKSEIDKKKGVNMETSPRNKKVKLEEDIKDSSGRSHAAGDDDHPILPKLSNKDTPSSKGSGSKSGNHCFIQIKSTRTVSYQSTVIPPVWCLEEINDILTWW